MRPESAPSRGGFGFSPRRALTLLEAVMALGLIALLLSILLPALSTARQASHRDRCADNLRHIGIAWHTYLDDHDKQFPFVPSQPAWYYGGMRFSRSEHVAYPDFDRPLTPYLDLHRTGTWDDVCVCCPADRGITATERGMGTGGRTAFESYGTSYRANAPLTDARLTGLTAHTRGMKRREITTAPSRLLLSGDPVWHEVAESTGRTADWHGIANGGNMLFLDGSVRFMIVRPKAITGPMVFDPIMFRRPDAEGDEPPPPSATSPARSMPDDPAP